MAYKLHTGDLRDFLYLDDTSIIQNKSVLNRLYGTRPFTVTL